jgi:hypothetical protein
VLAASVVLGLAACTSTTDPDQVGLYYMQGSSDGNQFDHCTSPGQTDDYEWNNQIVFLPTSVRTWTINDTDQADSREPIVVSAKPAESQPSGVQVKVWSQTKFALNTYCDDKGGEVKSFWEKTGRRYQADTEAGWKAMLQVNLVPALQKITRDVIRLYEADKLIGNIDGVQTKAQGEVATLFAAELNRLAGGPYFCGPSFNRSRPECPPIEFAILNVEYADPGIQAARNEKQKALEEAAAKVVRAQGEAQALLAEAQGKVDAANKIKELYNNPAWVKLQLAQMDLEAIKACGGNPNCKMVIGADGNLVIG